MDGKTAFMMGFEKEAAKWSSLLKAVTSPAKASRARRISRAGDKRKAIEAFKKTPIQEIKRRANTPGMRARKALGWGLIGGGAGAYGLQELSEPRRVQLTRGR